MAFRSQEGVDNYCKGLTVIQSQKSQGLNVFNEISEIFRRPVPQQKSSESETDEK